jgi:hypothetical protein
MRYMIFSQVVVTSVRQLRVGAHSRDCSHECRDVQVLWRLALEPWPVLGMQEKAMTEHRTADPVVWSCGGGGLPRDAEHAKRKRKRKAWPCRPSVTPKEAEATPPAFAEWLVELARRAA